MNDIERRLDAIETKMEDPAIDDDRYRVLGAEWVRS